MNNLNPVFDSIVKNHFPTDTSRIVSEHKFAHPYFIDGVNFERQNTIARLKSYFELTRESVANEEAEENPEWDAGFQAAMAIVSSIGKEN